ncbi:MAG: GntR family transcriptional regulator [bacterium]|nr:GntR family transcriptional regulator [bacterium]MDW8164044.1 GntR family transcriptional regulator [Candidatus Omnitrophota bacterium]
MEKETKIIEMLDRNSFIPLYVQLKNLLKEKIINNKFSYNAPIPSEKSLCKKYNISQITVRLALKDLENEGLIVRIPGKGTFIKKNTTIQIENTIGLIPPHISKGSSFFLSELIIGIKEKLREHNLVILEYQEIFKNMKKNLKGIILTEPKINDERIKFLKEKNIPFVVLGKPSEIENINVPYVDNNNLEIGEILTEHLIKLRRKRIGIILGPADLTVCVDRLEGYKNALKNNGIPFDEDLTYYGEFSEKTGFKGGQILYGRGTDGIVCCDDLIAIGCLKYLKQKKVKVPDEISVVGCNNSIFTTYIEPPLTTVEIFPRKLGFWACDKLLKLIQNGKIKDKAKIIKGKLIIRESSVKK